MENISGILLIHILLSYEQVVFDLNLIFNVILHLISCLFNKSMVFSKTNKLYSHFFLIFPINDVKSNMRAVNKLFVYDELVQLLVISRFTILD